MLRVALIPRGVMKSWRRQAFMHSKRKIRDSWRTGWKAKACTSFALYFKVFKNHLHYLWHVRVLSPDLLNHVYIHSFRSITKATEKFPGGGGIWSPGMDLWWGIWTAFRPREGGIFQKFSKNSNARGVARGGGCWSFDLTVHYPARPHRWFGRKLFFCPISGTEFDHFWNWFGKNKFPGALQLFK